PQFLGAAVDQRGDGQPHRVARLAAAVHEQDPPTADAVRDGAEDRRRVALGVAAVAPADEDRVELAVQDGGDHRPADGAGVGDADDDLAVELTDDAEDEGAGEFAEPPPFDIPDTL